MRCVMEFKELLKDWIKYQEQSYCFVSVFPGEVDDELNLIKAVQVKRDIELTFKGFMDYLCTKYKEKKFGVEDEVLVYK